jgi:hypothetical protein
MYMYIYIYEIYIYVYILKQVAQDSYIWDYVIVEKSVILSFKSILESLKERKRCTKKREDQKENKYFKN